PHRPPPTRPTRRLPPSRPPLRAYPIHRAVTLREVLHLDRGDSFVGGEREVEDLGVETQFGVEGGADVLGSAEAVLFALEEEVGDGDSASAQSVDDHFGLVGWDNGVFAAL